LTGRLVTVYVGPEPEYVLLPGVLVNDHDPEAGSPVSVTLPVVIIQEGCMISLATTAVGIA
jgi:hypothetical protein